MVEAVVDNQLAGEVLIAQGDIVHPARRHANHVQVGQVQRGGMLQQIGEGFLRVIVGQVVERVVRANAHAYPIRPGFADHRRQHLQRKTAAVGHGTAVLIIALVGAGGQELGGQVTAGTVQLHRVEAGRQGIGRGLPVVVDHTGNLRRGQRPRFVEGHHARLVGEHLAAGAQRRGRHGLAAGGLVVMAGHPADVHDLRDDSATGCVYRARHLRPRRNLGLVEQAGGATIAQAVGAGGDTLGDDSAGAGALGVVIHHDIGRHRVSVGPAAGHGRHDNAIAQLQRAECER